MKRDIGATFKRRSLMAGVAAVTAALFARESTRTADATDNAPLVVGQANTSGTNTKLSSNGGGGNGAFRVEGAGVAAITANASGANFAVNAVSATGIAVNASAAGGTGIPALQGTNTSTAVGSGGPGIQGVSTHGPALFGFSVNHNGMNGTSVNSVGLVGASTNNIGMIASTSSGAHPAGSFFGDLQVNGNFSATGMKSALVKTVDGSSRLVYCVESTEVWFEDLGFAQVPAGASSVAIDLDDTFAQLIHLDNYHVFVSPYDAPVVLTVSTRTGTSFLVHASVAPAQALTFSYRVVGRRKDVQGARLQRADHVRKPASVDVAPPAIPGVPEAPRRRTAD